MINKDYLNLLTTPARSIKGKAELYSSANSLIGEYSYNNALTSIEIKREIENKFFGFGICQKLTLKLRDKDRLINVNQDEFIKAYFDCGANDYINNFPNFYVTEVKRDENTNNLTITGYDLIQKAASHTLEEVELTLYTVGDLATATAEIMGLEDVEFINIDYAPIGLFFEEGANFNGTESFRDVWNDIAEVTQSIYYISGNKLVFKRLDKTGAPVLTIGKADYFTLEGKGNRRLSAITSATELGDNISYSLDEEGLTQYVRDNAFWDLREDRVTLVENAVAAIGGLAIEQVNCKWRGNYLLEIGDKVDVVAKDGSIYTFYLLDDAITYNGGFSEVSAWSFTEDAKEHSNPTSLGEKLSQTFAKVDKANKEIQLAVSEIQGYDERMSSLELNTSSISASVSELSNRVDATMTPEEVKIEIQEELENGVDKVTTSTGFTFNEEGMTVAKSNSEMSTTITEDGMKVYKNDTTMLSASNTGVDAVNLRANTYLIVGINSRFENYNNGSRTGCFWIG